MSPLRLSPSNPLARKNRRNRGCGARFLIAVGVIGSPGPLRFLVNEGDLVASVIKTALRSYARQGRLPVLGSHPNNFILYCGSDGLSPWETIGSPGGIRNFLLFPKQGSTSDDDASKFYTSRVLGAKRSLKRWFSTSLHSRSLLSTRS